MKLVFFESIGSVVVSLHFLCNPAIAVNLPALDPSQVIDSSQAWIPSATQSVDSQGPCGDPSILTCIPPTATFVQPPGRFPMPSAPYHGSDEMESMSSEEKKNWILSYLPPPSILDDDLISSRLVDTHNMEYSLLFPGMPLPRPLLHGPTERNGAAEKDDTERNLLYLPPPFIPDAAHLDVPSRYLHPPYVHWDAAAAMHIPICAPLLVPEEEILKPHPPPPKSSQPDDISVPSQRLQPPEITHMFPSPSFPSTHPIGEIPTSTSSKSSTTIAFSMNGPASDGDFELPSMIMPTGGTVNLEPVSASESKYPPLAPLFFGDDEPRPISLPYSVPSAGGDHKTSFTILSQPVFETKVSTMAVSGHPAPSPPLLRPVSGGYPHPGGFKEIKSDVHGLPVTQTMASTQTPAEVSLAGSCTYSVQTVVVTTTVYGCPTCF